MTKDTALRMIRDYCFELEERGEGPELAEMWTRWPDDGSERKAMRWLGFLQGVFYVRRYRTLESLKDESRTGKVRRR